MGLYWGLMTMGSDVFFFFKWDFDGDETNTWDLYFLIHPIYHPGLPGVFGVTASWLVFFVWPEKKCFWSLPYYLWCCKLKTEYMWFVMARKNLVFTFLTWVKLDTYDWTYWTWCSIIMDMENGWANKTNAVQSHSGFLGQHMLLDTRCKKWSTWGL